MNTPQEGKIAENLRDFIIWMKYAQYDHEKERRETFDEILTRTHNMYVEKMPQLKFPLNIAFNLVRQGYLLPSMRALHFAGQGIEQNHSRIYNCAATDISSFKDVADVMYLLLSGCGVGVGLENIHVTRRSSQENQQVVYVVPDSIEGWAESIQILLEGWQNGEKVIFDYSQIRPKGAEIRSINALAPGPDGLEKAHQRLTGYLRGRLFLGPAQMIHVLCLMAGAVMSGGIRRSAMIGLVAPGDSESIELKQSDDWWKESPELQYMNISVAWRNPFKMPRKQFTGLLKNALEYGEPGIINFGEENFLSNPCGEVMLNSKQFCNLVEVNATKLTPSNQEEIFNAAALLGFVQSRFTDFKFISPEWKTTTEKERLVGVSLTGIAGMDVLNIDLVQGRQTVTDAIEILNDEFGEAAHVPRITTVKPAGHTSLLMNTSSGIHSYPAPFYLRRITVPKDTVLGKYLTHALPDMLLEEDLYDSTNWKLVVPMKAPKYASCQTDPHEAQEMLDRINYIAETWLGAPRSCRNMNNISATVSVPQDLENEIIERIYNDSGFYHKGITVMRQFSGHDQPVWEPITEQKYFSYVAKWPMFLSTDLLLETRNNTYLQGELACAAGGCEVS